MKKFNFVFMIASNEARELLKPPDKTILNRGNQ